jgi:hypothetical protein
MVSVRFVNTETDYIEASIACSYASWRAGMDLIIEILAFIAGIILWGVLGFSWIWMALIIGSTVGLILRLLGYYVLPRMRYRSEPKYKEEYLLEFDEEEIRFKTNSIESKLDWSLYSKMIETRNLYILIYGKYNFSIIPKRALVSESERIEFYQLIDKHIKEKVIKK